MRLRRPGRLAPVLLLATLAATRVAAFDLQFTLLDNASGFTAAEKILVQEALGRAERMWETVIVGYQNGANIISVPISVTPATSGLAAAAFTGTTQSGDVIYATSGNVLLNVNEIENFANWQGPGANGLNFLDELLAHEIGHVLGIGTLWTANGVYVNNTYQFTGSRAVAAYETEFSDPVGYVPVEDNGGPGTPNAHWDQMMRSSGEAGDTNGPGGAWALSPLTGVVDALGRDRALELMSGAVDPDYLEPFLSRTTVESMRDLGYLVAAFEDFNGDGEIGAADLAVWMSGFGASGLQIDSLASGDSNRDRRVDGRDFLLWQRAVGTAAIIAAPEPKGLSLAVLMTIAFIARSATRRR